MFLMGVHHGGINIWDYHSQQHRATLTPSTYYYNPYMYSCNAVCDLLAICDPDARHVAVWDISDILDCRMLHRLTVTDTTWTGIGTICFMKHVDHLVLGFDNTIVVFDARSGSLLLQTSEGGLLAPNDEVNFLHCFDDKFISISQNGVVQEWTLNLTEIKRRELGISVGYACATLSEDFIAVNTEECVLVHDMITAGPTKIIAPISQRVSRIQFNADGSRILVSDGSWMIVYDIADDVANAEVFKFLSHSDACYSSDGSCIYGSTDEGIFCVDAEVGSSIPCQFSGPPLKDSQYYCCLFVLSPGAVVLM
jgi:WD40 repeat protein